MLEGKLRETLRAVGAAIVIPLVACAQGVELLREGEAQTDVGPDAQHSTTDGDAGDEDQGATVDTVEDPDKGAFDAQDASADHPDAGQAELPQDAAAHAEDVGPSPDTAASSSPDAASEAGLGDAGAPYSCPSCTLKVQWSTSTTSDTTPAIAGNLKLSNTGSVAIALSRVTLRYWLRDPAAETMVFECYYWDDGRGSGTNKCTRPADAGVNLYDSVNARVGSGANDLRFIELSFAQDAGQLSPGATAPGAMQVAFHLPSFTPMIQSDDPSFDDTLSTMSASMLFDAPKISAYVDGQLAWGSEP